jgi:hypothetical protein
MRANSLRSADSAAVTVARRSGQRDAGTGTEMAC